MYEQRAEVLNLSVGKPASLMQNGTVRHLTREPLSGAQIQALVREIASPEAAAQLGSSRAVTFAYRAPSGEVQVELESGADGAALLRPVGAPARGAPTATPRPTAAASPVAAAAVPPAAAPPPAAPAPGLPAGRLSQDLSGPRAALEELFRLLVSSGASDLHLRTGEPPMLRHHGELARQSYPPLTFEQLDAMLLSIMTDKEIGEFREGGDTDWAYEIEALARFRCNAARDRFGPMAVFRVIPNQIRTAEEMGLSQEVQNLCYLTKGLVVVTGPTGSGKSTTLAGLVDLINRKRTDHILTIEDPIEFVHPSKKCLVTQRQVGLHTRSFKHALRAALREDPDIILVGEMRDLETVSIAIETAETGHLVFGTLHTTTAASTIDRIIDQFPPDRQSQVRVMLSESLRGVIAQILCKKIGGGRVAAREILLTIPAVSNLIREGKTFQIPSIMQTNRKGGMVTLNDALMELVDAKQVEPKEAYMKAVEKAGFAAALRGKKHDTSFLGEA
jgi:twitching motility protein PilT